MKNIDFALGRLLWVFGLAALFFLGSTGDCAAQQNSSPLEPGFVDSFCGANPPPSLCPKYGAVQCQCFLQGKTMTVSFDFSCNRRTEKEIKVSKPTDPSRVLPYFAPPSLPSSQVHHVPDSPPPRS